MNKKPFPKQINCPFCKTNDNKAFDIIPIGVSKKSGLELHSVVHLDCLKLEVEKIFKVLILKIAQGGVEL